MGRNVGVGTRDMASAGRILLDWEREKGHISFSTAASVDMAWRQFADIAQANGVRRLEHVTEHLLMRYGTELAQKVVRHECTAGYAQRLISAVNTVMRLANPKWRRVNAVHDCGVPKRTAVRKKPPSGMDAQLVDAAIQSLRLSDQAAAAAVVKLCWALGLRIQEAALLNARKAMSQARSDGCIEVRYGTKGGRKRVLRILHAHQLEALEAAAAIQAQGISIIPSDLDWKMFRTSVLDRARITLKAHGIVKFHDLRAAYACRRYQELTGYPAPVLTGCIVENEVDRVARAEIALELGHNRISVVAAYVGGLA